MPQGFATSEGEDVTLLQLNVESDASKVEVAPPQQLLKKRTTGIMVGLALIGVAVLAIMSSRSNPSLRNGNIDATVQLNNVPAPTKSTLYIIKHTFKSEPKVKAWWTKMAAVQKNQTAFKEWREAVADVGFFNAFWLPTAEGGPFYCLWEAKEGKTKEDMQNFIDDSPLSPSFDHAFDNEVMQVDLALTGGQIPGFPDFFKSQTDSRRLLADRELASASSFYLIEHTFKKKSDVGPWWDGVNKMMSNMTAMKEVFAKTAETGFSDPGRFYPISKEGPIFCLWEAKAGKTEADMQTFIDTNKWSPAVKLHNHVMNIPLKLMGGHPPCKTTFE